LVLLYSKYKLKVIHQEIKMGKVAFNRAFQVNQLIVLLVFFLGFGIKLFSDNPHIKYQDVYLQKLRESIKTNQIDLGFPEPPTDVYFYPEDIEINSSVDIDTLLIKYWQLPDELIKSISDEGLIVTCLNLPYLHAATGHNRDKLQFALDNFNGIKELCSRENIHLKLKHLYVTPEFRLGERNLRHSQISQKYKTRIYYLSLFISWDEIISKFNRLELYHILDRSSLHCWLPKDDRVSPGDSRLLGDRIMLLLRYKPFLKYLKKEEIDESIVLTFNYRKYLYHESNDYIELRRKVQKKAASKRCKF